MNSNICRLPKHIKIRTILNPTIFDRKVRLLVTCSLKHFF
jgi:hypothetical protein